MQRTVFNWEAVLFYLLLNIMMTTKQYIQNADAKLKLFDWAWATKDTEKFSAYNKLLEDFLSKPEIKKLSSKRETLFYWSLYCGALQSFVLNNDKEKLEKLVKKCPLSKRELKTLFGV